MSKRRKSAPRPARLGPSGPAARVRWDQRHAGDRAIQRLYALGLDDDAIEALIRQPIGKKRDEHDPDRTGRIRRWSLTATPCEDGARHLLLFVFVVSVPSTAGDSGEILMITVIDKGPVS